MSFQAQRVGSGGAIDYTPAADVAAGTVVVQDELVAIAERAIAANKPGALAACGVFDFAKAAGAGKGIAVGLLVFWDDTNNVATTDAAGGKNKYLGRCIKAAADGDTTVRVRKCDGGGLNVAFGQHDTVAASDTVVTGLTKVIAAVACLDSDPGDDPEWVSCSIGDQAGAPAAGSILIKSWKNTAGNDPTPAAATTFAKKVNWIAVGL